MNGKIYRISHKTIKNSDLQYIGQTIKDIDQRLQEHIRDCNKGKRTKLHETMRMYGYINFEIELLEDKIKTEALLNERECYYINKYDSVDNGLNTNEGNVKSKKVIVLSPKEQLIQLIQSYLNDNVSDFYSKYIIRKRVNEFINEKNLTIDGKLDYLIGKIMTNLHFKPSKTTQNKILVLEKLELLQDNIITEQTKTLICYRKSK